MVRSLLKQANLLCERARHKHAWQDCKGMILLFTLILSLLFSHDYVDHECKLGILFRELEEARAQHGLQH